MNEIRKSLRGPWPDVFAQLRITVGEVLAAWPAAAVEIVLAKAAVSPAEVAADFRPWKEALVRSGIPLRVGYSEETTAHLVIVRRK